MRPTRNCIVFTLSESYIGKPNINQLSQTIVHCKDKDKLSLNTLALSVWIKEPSSDTTHNISLPACKDVGHPQEKVNTPTYQAQKEQPTDAQNYKVTLEVSR